MQVYLLRNLSELAEKRAQNVRQEAQLWDILARDLKREAKRQEERPERRVIPVPTLNRNEPEQYEERLYVRVKEAQKMMGMGHTGIYNEIKEGRLPVRKAGRKTLIALSDIHAWFDSLPSK